MTCDECKANRVLETIPYVAHESAMARAERSAKRLWIVVLLLILLLVGTNCAWVWYEAQFETMTTVEQENENGYNSYIGNDGDIFNGQTDNHNHPEA